MQAQITVEGTQRVGVRFVRGGWLGPRIGERRLQLLREGEERLLHYLMPVDGDGNDRLDADELRRLLRSIGQVPLTATEESQLFGATGSALTWRNFVDRLLLT